MVIKPPQVHTLKSARTKTGALACIRGANRRQTTATKKESLMTVVPSYVWWFPTPVAPFDPESTSLRWIILIHYFRYLATYCLLRCLLTKQAQTHTQPHKARGKKHKTRYTTQGIFPLNRSTSARVQETHTRGFCSATTQPRLRKRTGWHERSHSSRPTPSDGERSHSNHPAESMGTPRTLARCVLQYHAEGSWHLCSAPYQRKPNNPTESIKLKFGARTAQWKVKTSAFKRPSEWTKQSLANLHVGRGIFLTTVGELLNHFKLFCSSYRTRGRYPMPGSGRPAPAEAPLQPFAFPQYW